jgi:hypothetical protein
MESVAEFVSFNTQVLSDHGAANQTTGVQAADVSSPRTPSIIIRTKASTTSQNAQRDDSDEIGVVAMATRIARTPSVSSFGSDILRPLSMTSVDENANRSSTLSSLTSEGFRNMIQTNRSSWTGSELGNESISAMLERQGALANAIVSPAQHQTQPLHVRDKNMSHQKAQAEVENEKSPSSSQVTTPTGAGFSPPTGLSRGGSFTSPQRINLSEARQVRAAVPNDENNPASLSTADTPRLPQRSVPAAAVNQGRRPRLMNQRSIMFLR